MTLWEAIPFSAVEFFKTLQNDHCIRRVSDPGIDYLIKYIDGLKEKDETVTMLVENEYVDRDYLDDFANYYVRCYERYERFCKRIHFFRGFNKERFEKYLQGTLDTDTDTGNLRKTLNKDYLGFIIARPLPSAVIGRTVLIRPKNAVENEGEEDEKASIRCVRDYSENLNGIELTVKGLAFQEQDKVLAACATSALWSALQLTAKRFGYSTPNISETTLKATMYHSTSRPIPSGGLTVSQLCQAIKEAGLAAEALEIYAPRTDEQSRQTGWKYNLPLLSACYAYLRAGLPVVLAVRVEGSAMHAITLVGYAVTEDGPGMNEMKIYKPTRDSHFRGSRITRFFAHDDQIGPYCELPILFDPASPFPIALKSRWGYKKDGKLAYRTFIPKMIVTPLYHKIRVPFISTYEFVFELETILRHLLDEDIIIEWDVFLSSINDYREEISLRSGVPSNVRRSILEHPHPRFFWRLRAFMGDTEICEMLNDATGIELSFQPHAAYFFQTYIVDRLKSSYPKLRKMMENDSDRLRLLDFVHSKACEQFP